MSAAFIAGYLSTLSLIAAIGAQNAFVLRQGLRREHVWATVLICGGSDTILIAFGITGFQSVMAIAPWIERAMLYAGAAFLFIYGAMRFYAAYQGAEALVPAEGKIPSLKSVVISCLIITWGNPHVYLDTVALIGAISTGYTPYEYLFGLGASLASISFFIALGFGARFLAPVFAKPKTWVYLEAIIGSTMWLIALALIKSAY